VGIPGVFLSAGNAVRARYQVISPTPPPPESESPESELAESELPEPRGSKMGNPVPFGDAILAFTEMTWRGAQYVGRAMGRSLYAITVGALRGALAMVAAILNREQLRRISIIAGLLMLALGYVLDVTS
jgi:hypothetical protein